MDATHYAQLERRELTELLLKAGPDAPTLCEGWTTKDLAAHIAVREGRPDAAAGIVLPPLSGWTDRVQNAMASLSYPELVRRVRTGPPTLSVFSLPGMDGLGNLIEFTVHHEDVRRARPGWTERQIPQDLADELWARLSRMARLFYRRVPVGITLVRTDGPGRPIVARSKEPMVTLSGSAMELMLRSYGRREVHLEIDGPEDAVEQFERTSLGV
jgi:uncharacterized protein (TIGR03085 family)